MAAYFFVIIVNPAVPAQTLKELIAYAKAHPSQLNYASTGTASLAHLATELFAMSTGTQLVLNVVVEELPPAETANTGLDRRSDLGKRAALWELSTAMGLLQAGADILIMYHPEAAKALRRSIDRLMAN